MSTYIDGQCVSRSEAGGEDNDSMRSAGSGHVTQREAKIHYAGGERGGGEGKRTGWGCYVRVEEGILRV